MLDWMFTNANGVASICTQIFFCKTISFEPKVKVVISYLQEHFKGCSIHAVYEASFCGFGLQSSLSHAGIPSYP
jgi:hypothetical protein